MEKEFFVYILASKRKGTLYTGVTSNLLQRISEHREKSVKGFTEKYSVDKLVYFERHPDAESAITREKQIKRWKREWKIRLIKEENPQWNDLYNDIVL